MTQDKKEESEDSQKDKKPEDPTDEEILAMMVLLGILWNQKISKAITCK